MSIVQPKPDFDLELKLINRGINKVAGVDEAGRGPLAGPVVAAAVILDPKHIPKGLNDSKKLSKKKREELFYSIVEVASYSVGIASVEEIDELNILYASHLAMIRAIKGLRLKPGYILIDGNMVPKDLNIPASPVIKGDNKSVSIAAASIVAKVSRDKMMVDLEQHFKGYGWEKNGGYPTKAHILAIKTLGVTPHHRVSFRPIHNILYQD
jgi:ribonuclease HII